MDFFGGSGAVYDQQELMRFWSWTGSRYVSAIDYSCCQKFALRVLY